MTLEQSSGSITRLIEDLAGDTTLREPATDALWRRYVAQLVTVACRNLDDRARRREGEDDVVQSVFASFFARLEAGKLEVANRDELWRLLVAMTTFKSRRAIAKHRRQKRDVRRETAPPAGGDSSEDLTWSDLVGDGEATPEQAAAFVEDVEQRLARLDERLREIVILRLEGYSNREIAERLDVAERTVERKLERVRSVWLAEAEQDSPA